MRCRVCGEPNREQRPFCVDHSPYAQAVKAEAIRRGLIDLGPGDRAAS